MSHKLSTGLNHCNEPVGQKGAGLPIALFIVTVLSLIVLGMSQLQESSGNAISLQIQSQRAFFAAESGAQIALGRVLPGTKTASEVWARVESEGINGQEIDYAADGLKGCIASLAAESVEDEDDTSVIVLVRITTTGICGGDSGPDSASRTVEVKVR